MTDVVVIGGGITGTGVARDLALRGLDVTLVERGPLAAGTTGRMHGLLHSGARYADSDPQSARDCLAENRVLRAIAPHCLTDSSGLYCLLPDDDSAYLKRKERACVASGIPAERLSLDESRTLEPGLSIDVEGALRVPDAMVDPFRLTAATAAGAESAGARIRTETAVTSIRRQNDRVIGVEVDPAGGSTEAICAAHVVNAAGAWTREIAALGGVTVPLRLSRGTMAAVEPRVADTVVHRCRPRSQGDIAVPGGDATVLGTTDEPIENPDGAEPRADEPAALLDALAPVIPMLATTTVSRTFAGVRPLVASPSAGPAQSGATTSATRDFRVINHVERDGIDGLTSVVGGKLTTHRLMAERVANEVCHAIGCRQPGRTAQVPLPGIDDDGLLVDALSRYGITESLETAPW